MESQLSPVLWGGHVRGVAQREGHGLDARRPGIFSGLYSTCILIFLRCSLLIYKLISEVLFRFKIL